MRIPILSLFITSPFDGLQEHAERVKECAVVFQQAIECHITRDCKTFRELRNQVSKYESSADAIKRRIRGHLPVGTLMPVDKFQLFLFLREQDHVMDGFKESLNWISYREEPGIPGEFQKDFLLLIDSVIDPVEELPRMVESARTYFQSRREKHRKIVKTIIQTIRKQEAEADKAETMLKHKIFMADVDPVTVFHMIRLSETIGGIADSAENTADMMRAMVAR